jgi:hypothetical protein
LFCKQQKQSQITFGSDRVVEAEQIKQVSEAAPQSITHGRGRICESSVIACSLKISTSESINIIEIYFSRFFFEVVSTIRNNSV